MANINRLVAFGKFNTGEGDRISYTYSVIDADTGTIIEQNKKGNFLVLDDALEGHIKAIEDYISEKFLK